MFATALRNLARRAATPLARGHAIAPRPLALAGGVSTLAAMSVSAATGCEPAPILTLAGTPGSKRERTLILVKPDGVERGCVGAVISKFEAKGYKLVGLKMLTPTLEQAEDNYSGLKALPFFPSLCKYFSSGPVVAMCWEGPSVIKNGRTMVDEIRAVYAADRGRNCIDGSDSVEGAKEELSRWFNMVDIQCYTRAIDVQVSP